jgi:hypothetical protein
MANQSRTIDPASINSAAKIPPTGSQFQGTSPQGLIDVYNGSLAGDIDAQPAAKELLVPSSDTGGLANAEYIYNQVSALYGGPQLPALQSPSGKSVKSVIFVSGSKKNRGGYGAFHLSSSQTDFDTIVVDSLNASGNYSTGSGLAAISPASAKLTKPHLFPLYRGPQGLLSVVEADAPEMKAADSKTLKKALAIASQSRSALAKYIESHSRSALPTKLSEGALGKTKVEAGNLATLLASTNDHVSSLAGVAAAMSGNRQYLSTALFAAEIIESFELLTGKGDAGKTDGEAVSRVVSFKLAPEIALVPGFDGQVTQKWWSDGQPDWVNDNSQDDQSEDGNAAGVMFLLFLNDFLGLAMSAILAHMPTTGGAPLGNTYAALLIDNPNLAQIAGGDGKAAFRAMVSLLKQNTQLSDGTLNLPADGNPFPSMPNSRQGGLFSS